jgi:hypothetical protein
MSSSYDSSRSRRRGVWSHWVPLVVTVTVATVGIAAWAWSQRQNDEEEEGPPPADLDYDNADYGDNPAYGTSKNNASVHNPSFSRAESATYGVTEAHAEANANAGWGNQMSGALRRTPSPQQFLSSAGKTVAAGVGAVGAAMGTALAAIREEDKNAYKDHETWSEEAESRKGKDKDKDKPSQPREAGKRRKTVAVIVSADTNLDDLDEDGFHEHAVWHIDLENPRKHC